MSKGQTEVLNHEQIADRITRIAWQVYEDFAEETEVILAGIAGGGYRFAELIREELEKISPLNIKLIKVVINKDNPRAEPPRVSKELNFDGKQIVVVDDVLNSGSTLIYGVRYFLDFDAKGISTAVLVDRSHKRYPVKGDFKGISLSTGILEHVSVQLDKLPYSVVIS